MRLPLDAAAVGNWCHDHVSGFNSDLRISQFSGGQSNPTYKLSTPDRSYVLRRKPPGQLLKSAHAVDREFRVQRALQSSDVPVAQMLAYCEDESVIGAEFYIMEMIEGRSFDQPSLPDLSKNERGALIDAMNLVLTEIHSVDLARSGLSDFGPEGHYCQRQTERWCKQYRASQTEDITEMDALMDWLGENMPDDDGQRTLVHGDYRLDNLIFHEHEP
ncbi:MAG: phosphotransferase family protein, partial [Pseudomonadota bacterium]